MNKIVFNLLLIGLFHPAVSHAVSFGIYDPNSMAMGGVGVATATASNASYYNPAMLARYTVRKEKGRNSRSVFPQVAARYSEAIQDIYDFKDNDVADGFTNSISDFVGVNSIENAQTVVNTGQVFQSDLNAVSQGPFSIDFSTSVVLGIAGRFEGGAFFFNARGVGDGVIIQTDDDRQLINNYIAALSIYAETGVLPDAADFPGLIDNNELLDQTDNLSSSATGTYISVFEYGMTFAKEVNLFGESFSFGVSPKYVRVTSYDFFALASDNNSTTSEKREHDGNLNLDIGIEKSFSSEWRAGLVLKNLISQDYLTALNNTVEYEPQYRLGAAYKYDHGHVAADFDLKANKPVGSGDPSQILGVGANYRLNRNFNFQLGYQMNLKATGNHDKGIISAGMEIDSRWSIFHISYADNNVEKAGAIQAVVKF